MKNLAAPTRRPWRTPLLALLLLLAIAIAPARVSHSADSTAPQEIGGFRLGTSIDDYQFTSYQNFLKQVVIENVGEFRKGVIEYGVCERPGEIVDIKMKYADTSEGFFDELLKRYKQKLGPPERYAGDSFGILKAWKWSFRDSSGERISLTLQYNVKDPDESIGSVVKLALPDRIEAERACFNKICATREKAVPPATTERNWDLLIPR